MTIQSAGKTTKGRLATPMSECSTVSCTGERASSDLRPSPTPSVRRDSDPEGVELPVTALDAHRIPVRLKILRLHIISDCKKLAALYHDAIERKILLGEHLSQAREYCDAARRDWTAFLRGCKLNDRTAREAISFFRNAEKIRQMRHDGAARTVSSVRLALAQPRESRGVRDATSPGDDETSCTSGPVERNAAIRPAVRESLPLAAPSEIAAGADAGVDDHRSSEPQELIRDTIPPALIVVEGSHADDAIDSLPYRAFIQLYDELGDIVIASGEARTLDAIVDLTRRAMPILRAAIGRLDAALDALDGTGSLGHPG